MILRETTETGHRKIDVRITKRLPKLVWISREKICKGTEEIDAAKTIRYIGSQPNAIDTAANLPKVFALRTRVRRLPQRTPPTNGASQDTRRRRLRRQQAIRERRLRSLRFLNCYGKFGR